MSRDVWQQVIDVNLTGVFLSCQAEGNAMIDNGGGSIVNIGSIAAAIAIRGLQQVHYNAAKAGVGQISASLAVEWVEHGIRVNTVSPGHTRTPIAEHPDVYEMVKAFLRDMPMGRLGDTSEIVGPTVFLLSDASSFCTGVNINVDGGTVIGGHGPVA
jgi:NAD(P)-dependent dehydrogenase (short-subunit alcohol dehydrogenase family)